MIVNRARPHPHDLTVVLAPHEAIGLLLLITRDSGNDVVRDAALAPVVDKITKAYRVAEEAQEGE